MNKALKYAAGAIALYIVVAYASGASKDAAAGGGALSSIIRSFQGR